MGFYSWAEINAYRQQSDFYDFGKEVASGVRDFACGLYKGYQGFVIRLPGSDNPVSDFLHGAWDSICTYPNSPGLPVPEPPPFTGGQCPVGYRVRAKTALYDPGEYDATGPIKGFRASSRGDRVPFLGVFLEAGGGGGGAISFEGTWLIPLSGVPSDNGEFIQVLRRLDNQPDNCGNLPTPLPPSVPPPSTETDKPVFIPKPPGGGGGNWTVPFFYAPVQPTLNFNVDVGGINFQIDVGGISFGDDGTGSASDIAEILRRLDSLEIDLESLVARVSGVEDSLLDSLPEIAADSRVAADSLTRTYSGSVSTYRCDSGSDTVPYSSVGLEVLSSAVDLLSDQVAEVQRHLCEESFDVVPPERFLLSPGKEIPQLVLVYRDLKPNGAWGYKRTSLTVPYPDVTPDTQGWNPPGSLLHYYHGSYEGIGMIACGAKFTVNALTEGEAVRLLSGVSSSVVRPDKLEPYQARIARRLGTDLTEYFAYLRFAFYYSKGSSSNAPDWVRRFRPIPV